MSTVIDREPRTQRVMHPLKPRLVTVAEVEPITARYVRITFTGEDLADFVSLDPGDHIKLAFPDPGEEEPVLPRVSEKGMTWPEDRPRPAMRDYTPRLVDNAGRRLVVEFVIHGDGPASNWAAQAQPGHKLGVLGPRGSKVVEPAFDWYLMIGDETALPGIARRLGELPRAARAIAMIEVDGPSDEQPLAAGPNAEIIWLYRDTAPSDETSLLENAVRALALPEGEGFIWAGGEANSLRPVRRYLLNEAGHPREWASFDGHWKRGVINHDHHEPIEG
jgi:NADPH-dependent ferric siderophore reductase